MYTTAYDSTLIRNSSYDISKILRDYFSPETKALDLGCGTCRKIIPLSPIVSSYHAIDHNRMMLSKARQNLLKAKCSNIILVQGDNFYLPFNKDSFDIITSFLTHFSIPESHRTLRQKGLFIIETLGANDKKEVKIHFGKDKLGWRGMLLNTTNDERINYLQRSLRPFFTEMDVQVISFQTEITKKGFESLLLQTPTIRSFSIRRDKKIIDEITSKEESVHFTEERILITCYKK